MKYTNDYFTPMEFLKIVSTFVYNYVQNLRVFINEIYSLSQDDCVSTVLVLPLPFFVLTPPVLVS